MKKNLLTKIRNRKGFTLAELLIVVAIIGVLVAVSIPIFTAQLAKARKATNEANLRAAKAAAVADYLVNDDFNGKGADYTYDIANGSVSDAAFTSAGPITKIEDATDKVQYTAITVHIADDDDSTTTFTATPTGE